MMDVTDLDRYAELAFSSQISVEGSDINYTLHVQTNTFSEIHYNKHTTVRSGRAQFV